MVSRRTPPLSVDQAAEAPPAGHSRAQMRSALLIVLASSDAPGAGRPFLSPLPTPSAGRPAEPHPPPPSTPLPANRRASSREHLMTKADTTTDHPLAGETTTVDGQTVHRIPLTGRDGAGRFALLDIEGLERLRQAGARCLYLVSCHKHPYVTFLQVPTKDPAMASRVVIDAPAGRRVIYRNGDRLDLRASNLMLQPRKEEPTLRLVHGKGYAVDQAWKANRQMRRLEERAWKQAASPSGPAE